MKQTLTLSLSFLFMLCCTTTELHACGAGTDLKENRLFFTENQGQWPSQVEYLAEFPHARLFLEKDKLTWLLLEPGSMSTLHDFYFHHRTNPQTDIPFLKQHAFQMSFVGANPTSQPVSDCHSGMHRNYYIGKDQSKWASNVGVMHQVDYPNLYNGIDLQVYSQEGTMKYDFIVKAGADPQQIELAYEHVDGICLEDGALKVKTSVNTLIEKAPFAYQYVFNRMVQVPCEFVLEEGKVSFSFPEGYDQTKELVIDPELVFASYSGSYADNWGFTATYDVAGNLYGGGIVFGFNYPTTMGAFQESFLGMETDMGITKFSTNGQLALFSTYLGGSRGNETPNSLIVNSQNELVILGVSSSADYPVLEEAYDTSFAGGEYETGGNSISGGFFARNGCDVVVTVLDELGYRLQGSTYLGGNGIDGVNVAAGLNHNYADDLRGEVFLDQSDNIYIATSTYSTDIKGTSGSFQPDANGDQEGCIFKLNPSLTEQAWASYFGGSGSDAIYSLKLDSAENIFIAGGTRSEDLAATENGVQSTYGGGSTDGFIAKISNDGKTLVNTTYLGTTAYDQSYFVDVDEQGRIYTVGQTDGVWEIQGEVFSEENGGQFIQGFNNDLTETLFATTFGTGKGEADISPTAFLVDKCNKIYVSGWGSDLGGPNLGTFGLTITENAFQQQTDGNDFYFIVLEELGKELLYATYFGGTSREHVDGGTSRFDKEGVIYQAVCAGCGGSDSFPTTDGAWSEKNNSANCNLGVIKFAFEVTSLIADFEAPLQGCLPLTIEFDNTSVKGERYIWDFDDPNNPDDTSTEVNPTYTFTEPGEYEVTLITFSEETCNPSDAIQKVIKVIEFDEVPTTADFTVPETGCAPFTVTFDNNSLMAEDFEWDFGDANAPKASTLTDPTHTYQEPGIYEVTLKATSRETCNKEDMITKTIEIVAPAEEVAIQGIQDYCFEEDVLLFTATVNGGRWSGPGILFAQAGQFYPELGAGDYTITYTVQLDVCEIVVEESFTIYSQPTIEVTAPARCSENGESFEVDIRVSGNELDYQFADGTTVLSNEITTLTFPITEDTLQTVEVTGLVFGCSNSLMISVPKCSCDTYAGDIVDDSPLLLCAGDSATIAVENVVLESNQEQFFVVYEGTPDTLGQIKSLLNTTGVFYFEDLFESSYNTQYYIASLVVTINLGGDPEVDQCFAFTTARPVVFLKPLDLLLSESCNEERGVIEVLIAVTGGLPEWDATESYTISGEVNDNFGFMDSYSFEVSAEKPAFMVDINDDNACERLNINSSSPQDCQSKPFASELMKFHIDEQADGNHISYASATEYNNDYYTIERSADGITFIPIGRLDGAGTKGSMTFYNFFDPILCGSYYYRLSWTDYDGKVDYSSTIYTKGKTADIALQVYPNPVQSTAQLAFAMESNTGFTIKVFNVQGQVVAQQELVEAGCSHQLSLKVDHLSAGVYWLTVEGNTNERLGINIIIP